MDQICDATLLDIVAYANGVFNSVGVLGSNAKMEAIICVKPIIFRSKPRSWNQ